MNRLHQLCTMTLAVVLCHALPARADTPPSTAPAAPDALTDQARELHIKGAELFDKGQYAQAEAAFLAAWALKKHFQIAANLGACELKLGKRRSAAEHLAYAGRTFVPQDSPERAKALTLLKEAKTKIATVTLTVDVDGADVLLDGIVAGTSPLADPLFLDPGAHMIEIRRDAEVRSSTKLDAKAGAEESIALSAKRASPPLGGSRKELVIAGGATAGVALVAGVVLAAVSGARGADARALREQKQAADGIHACGTSSPDCDKYHAAINEQDALGNAAVWSFIGAGLVGGGTLVYLLTAPRAPEPESAKIEALPWLGPTAGGVVVRGAW